MLAKEMYDFEEIPAAVNSVFDALHDKIKPLLDIDSNAKCDAAIHVLELIDSTIETEDDPKRAVVNLLASAIEKYENGLPEIQEFEKSVGDLDPALSTLRLLMNQHNLKNKDIKQLIGVSDSAVSMILSGDREITRSHIDSLSRHFGISPALFF